MFTLFQIWLVSECKGKQGAQLRMNYVNEMMKTVPKLKRYGKCFNNSQHVARTRLRILLQSYKFYLAFENSLHCKDYVTEKFFENAILNNVVPVVWGTRKEDYLRIAPPHSFIHAEDFSSPAELSKYLLYLDTNDTAYREYFRWRENPEKSWEDLQREVKKSHPQIQTLKYRSTGYEELCRKLILDHEPKTIPSLRKFFFDTEDKHCLAADDEFKNPVDYSY